MPDKTYRTILEEIARTKSSIVTVFNDFCRIAACVCAAETREEEYFQAIKSYDKEELGKFSIAYALLVQEMEQKPFIDVLGPYYIDIASHSSKQTRGEFYTPPEICELMALMSVDTAQIIEKGIPFTVSDPCCGSGGMILALAKQLSPIVIDGDGSYVDLLCVTCQDINPVGVDMCYVNTSLWGIPATMILGNTLKAEVNKVWKNIHWHRVGEDQHQTLADFSKLITEPAQKETGQEPQKHPANPKLGKGNQFEFDLDLGTSQELAR